MKIFICLFLISSYAFAAKHYISGVQKVTFRTGAGTDNKIIKMLETTSAVELLEQGETWSKVKDSSGEEGYVLNRFLSKDVPYVLRYKWIKSQYDKLKSSHGNLKDDFKEDQTQIDQLKMTVKTLEDQLKQTKNNYEELKLGSADYLGLKKKYDLTLASLEEQTTRVRELESKISIYYIKWFLAGAGVLFLGWLIGLFSRKKKNHSQLKF